MPQFAVIARSYRPTNTSERSLDLETNPPPRLRLRKHGDGECIFETPKAYLVEAETAQAAMRRIEAFAAQREIQMMVHRAVEVAENLSAKITNVAGAGSQDRM
jgi:hypothetical protein